ncbi:MAG TPA: hypothetical protein VNA19_03110 [Pyrinomonadaceae bacterium]|jgi:hypothetical protein|nr:hypothetical protein [Pyrinomonadaceae bacterium]
MRLRLYCNRYGHIKDALVCSVNCVYRTRCPEFALFYDEHRADLDALVGDYYAARSETRSPQPPQGETKRTLPVLPPAVATPVELRALIRLEVKKEMADAVYIWIDKEDRAELLETAEVIRRAERGMKAKHIYKVAQEMELRFQLVPRKRIEKARRAAEADAERATVRRTRTNAAARNNNAPAPVPFPAPVSASNEENAHADDAPRRTRTRTVKAVGGRS